MSSLFENIPFIENSLYERIISDISSQKYSIVDDFFSEDEVIALRHSLLLKYEEDAFKKSAEQLFFNKIKDLKDYLNRTCFLGINQKEFHYAIYPFPGKVVIFKSQELEHEVKPVNTPRLSITGWLKTR
ncbi:2OG-Fe(II) oxygenase [Winogradskyella sp. F6397]|uniref:2OG-Fe(II) oxygenase n=1 Tax=Winogradskyella marina TaxID=2785530 RepID=A0ABS0EFC9_9FLAO|nr:2OG-Fe(II) oxygenase [Winogradskyella marina]MBF8149165.1 2OG-Fe(II) oxygenase [Winogradskyella marina]